MGLKGISDPNKSDQIDKLIVTTLEKVALSLLFALLHSTSAFLSSIALIFFHLVHAAVPRDASGVASES